MALAFLQNTIDETDLTTYTFSSQNLGTAIADRHIIVNIFGRKAGATTNINSVTVGGVLATIVKQQSTTATNTSVCGIAIAAVPTGATGDIVIEFGAGLVRCAVSVYRATGLLSATAYDSDSSSANDPTVSLDVPYGFAIGAALTATGSTIAWTGLTEDHDTAITSGRIGSASSVFTAPESARTITADFSSSLESSGVFASWRFIAPNNGNAKGLNVNSLGLSRI